jgi:cysteine-rich repeat protein
MANSDNCLNGCLDAVCGDGFVKLGVEQCDDGNMNDNDGCPNNCGISEIGCNDILTNMNMWGNVALGVDLRAYTNSTLHWIGCPGNGCPANTFYCNYDPVAHTMQFGTTSNGAMRSVVDPNDANGDVMPMAGGSCCNNNLQLCNSPDSNNNGVNVDMVDALCASLGYSDGVIVRESNDNVCPQAHALTADGSSWSSDYINNGGWGAEYRCSQN